MLPLLSLIFACNHNPEPNECVDSERTQIDNVENAVNSNTAFGIDIFHQLVEPDVNLFFSPYSISSALAMLELGANGITEEEMNNVLHVPEDNAAWHDSQGVLSQDLHQPERCDYQLSIANRAFGQEGMNFLEAFQTGLEDTYGAPLEDINFGEPEAARQHINKWVSDNTKEKIPNLFPEGSINLATRLVLANAIYMNAPWKTAFDPNDTQSSDFSLSIDETTTVDMMWQEEMDGRIGYFENEDVFEVDYKGDELALTIVRPHEIDGLAAIEADLSSDKIEEWVSNLNNTELPFGFPKLELRYKAGLNEPLKDLGMDSAFKDGVADFSGIVDDLPLFVSAVIHEAWVKISEEGTEAAAATGVVVGTESAGPMPFVVDRPFLFLVRDKLSDTILFIGRVVNPNG